MMRKNSLLFATLLIALLALLLLSNYSDRFEKVERSYRDSTSLNLNAETQLNQISRLLQKQGYTIDTAECRVASEFIFERLQEEKALPTLYDLNKRRWQIPASELDSLPDTSKFSKRLAQSKENLGIDSIYYAEAASELPNERVISSDHSDSGTIEVTVLQENEDIGLIDRLFKRTHTPCQDVVVRLSKEIIVDSLDQLTPQRVTLAFLKTDNKGEVVFKGLDPSLSYSVLPIKENFEYGSSQGTIGGNLVTYKDNKLTCEFTQQEHRLRLFDATTLRQIKDDSAMTIRSPEEFKEIFIKYLVMFMAAWWALWILNRQSKRKFDEVIMSVLMTLTGLCLLSMFSLNDPLTDKLLGRDMAHGILAGVGIIALMLQVDFKKLYQNQLKIGFDVAMECIKWFFKPYRQKVSYLTATLSNQSCGVVRKILALVAIIICLPLLLLDLLRITALSERINRGLDKLPKGSGYLMIALILTVLLFTPLGVSVGGMRVNLNIGILFQPSEIAKYLVIFFMACYFSLNANKIVKYSEKGNTNLMMSKLKSLGFIILGLGFLMGLYLVLGDMGPALVLAMTFIIMYSIIKSKVDLEGSTSEDRIKRIFSCDFAMLVYGVLSFILCLVFGRIVGNMGIFCLVWIVVWVTAGILKKQVFESPILFNLIIAAFIFGGDILSDIPGLDSVGERLESRNEMCTNTWGTLPLDGATANAGENTQVAEGLWGLASGGLWGQGLGNGSPHFIPAFHTDMILESIGEQMGFVGLLLIIVLMAILLRRSVVIGYRTGHPFTFYLALGIAIVTAVQFIIISLGSTGIIPLTGVTVPLLSYGKVSMILNMAAFGIILSISAHDIPKNTPANNQSTTIAKQNIGQYNYTISLLTWGYCALTLVICGVFFYYQCPARNNTLIRPIYINNVSGVPIVEYNPRIEQLTSKMRMGDVYDRNGILLATSDPTKLKQEKHMAAYKTAFGDNYKLDTLKRQARYYPFKEHLYFMVGDYNSKVFFSSSDVSPRGYMAEARHLAELRGYDNVKRDENNKPIKIDLESKKFSPGKFYSSDYTFEQYNLQLRDYSELLDYLKEGVNSDAVERLNNQEQSRRERRHIEPKDIQLTVDAVLQTRLQESLEEYAPRVRSTSYYKNKVRISVVVMDARGGDVLASANYPMPDYDILPEVPDNYKDYYTSADWKAYTDRDLGLTYATAPGSTAKVISALAGLRKIGTEAANPNNPEYSYYIHPNEIVFRGEPRGQQVNMDIAIVKSSNCYFINLVNDHNLYGDLAYIYRNIGVQFNGNTPYLFNYDANNPGPGWETRVTQHAPAAIAAYNRYQQSGRKEPLLKHPAWYWTWGQGLLATTPLAMARTAAIVANDGKMATTRFLMDQPTSSVEIVSPEEAARLNSFMKKEAQIEKRISNPNVGGKTGTPERSFFKVPNGHEYKPNDGWFICFIENSTISQNVNGQQSTTTAPLAVAVRLERLDVAMSDQAVNVTRNVVLPVLYDLGYSAYK